MKCKKICSKVFLIMVVSLLLICAITACTRNSKKQEDMAGPGDNTSLNNAYEDSNQNNDLTPGQNDNLNSATSGESQVSTENQSETSTSEANTAETGSTEFNE